MKVTCFERPPKFRNRMIMMIIGVLLQGLGLSLLINLNLGTDPLFLSDAGCNQLCADQLWNSSTFMPLGYIPVCDSV